METPICFCGWFADTFSCNNRFGFTVRIDDRTVEKAREVVRKYQNVISDFSEQKTVRNVVVSPRTGLIVLIQFKNGSEARTTLQADGNYLGPDNCSLSAEEFVDFFMIIYNWNFAVHSLYEAIEPVPDG